MIHLPSFLARTARLSLIQQSVRTYAGYWNKDWRPGPVPTTEVERRAAAKKYGLIPEDYECYPDDGTGYGDYPKLPIVSAESKDPHYNYDMDEFKRNFGEPLHVEDEMYGEDRLDYNKRYIVSLRMMILSYVGVVAFFCFLAWTGEYVKLDFVKRMPKHKPYDGKKHYTFETVVDC